MMLEDVFQYLLTAALGIPAVFLMFERIAQIRGADSPAEKTWTALKMVWAIAVLLLVVATNDFVWHLITTTAAM